MSDAAPSRGDPRQAAKQGASTVLAIEASRDMVDLAKLNVQRNGAPPSGGGLAKRSASRLSAIAAAPSHVPMPQLGAEAFRAFHSRVSGIVASQQLLSQHLRNALILCAVSVSGISTPRRITVNVVGNLFITTGDQGFIVFCGGQGSRTRSA